MKKEHGLKYISSCRLCLAVNRRTINILHTHLQPLYEKLINSKIHDEVPLCFICHRRLQQCHQFVNLIKETQSMREEYIKNGCMVENKPKPLIQLSVCSIMNFGIPFEASDSMETVIKEEEPEIKEEPESDIESEENGIEDSEELEDENEEDENEEDENEEDENEEDESEEDENEEDESEEEPPAEESSDSEDDMPLTVVKRKRGAGKAKTNKIEKKVLNKKIKREQE